MRAIEFTRTGTGVVHVGDWPEESAVTLEFIRASRDDMVQLRPDGVTFITDNGWAFYEIVGYADYALQLKLREEGES